MADNNLENNAENHLEVSVKKSIILWNPKDFQIIISLQFIFFLCYIIVNIIGYYATKPYIVEREIGTDYWAIDVDYVNNIGFWYFIFSFIYAIGILIFFWVKDSRKSDLVAFLSGFSKSLLLLFIAGSMGPNIGEEFIFSDTGFDSKSEGKQRLDDFFNVLLFWLVLTIFLLFINYYVFKYLIKLHETRVIEDARKQKEKEKEISDLFESSEKAREFAQKFVNTRISLIKQDIDTLTPKNINTHVRSILTQDIDKLNQLFELNELPVFPTKYLIEHCYELTKPFRVDFKKILKDHLTASLLEGDSTPLSEDDEVSKLIDDLLEKYEHMELDQTGKE
ncbi:MAG: hypothetical protein ACXAD7_08810 [Candidatus Kariarchaeaceae archaeon]|jgi:hypothetical protein